MYQMKTIGFTETIYSYELSFLNGNISLPKAYGGYVIAPGCGSGKTTVIKQIILSKFYEGVVYAASTIDECDSMYDYLVNACRTNKITKVINGKTFTLTPDKIISIHSDPRKELDLNTNKMICTDGVDTSLWSNHTEKVSDYYVVICTHHKLVRESPLALFTSSFNTPCTYYSTIRTAVTGIGGSTIPPRQWIIVDELPTVEPLKVTINKNTILLMGGYHWNKLDPSRIDTQIAHNSFSSFKDTFESVIVNDTKAMSMIGNMGSKSVRMKSDLIASIAYEELDNLTRSNDKEVDVIYNMSELIMNGMKTRVLLFDGTGDLTHINSERFNVLTYPIKYDSPITVFRFKNHVDRIVGSNNFLDKDSIEYSLNNNLLELQKIIDENKRTLIVTWKNLKEDYGKPIKFNKSANTESVLMTSELNGEFNLPKWYKNRLLPRNGHEFDIIHYQSGRDKATNDYRDYDTVVFLGKFQVPNSAITDFNKNYGCGTDLAHYSTYQLVQAICRTRIRNHRGEPINVYFSSDWSNLLIKDVMNYMTHGSIDKVNSENDSLLDDIKPKWRKCIKLLCDNYPVFKDAIKGNYGIDFNISLDEISSLIPMNEKKVKYYTPLVKYLSTIGINMEVTSVKRGRYSNTP